MMLAHCNKYRDHDDNLVYEGTGDVKSDTDELLFMEFEKHDHGQTMSIYPDKTRGEIHKLTFEMDKERNIKSSLLFKDVKTSLIVESKLKNTDKPHALYIVLCIRKGITIQGQIVHACRTKGFSSKGTFRILDVGSDERNLNQFLVKGDKDTKRCNAIRYGVLDSFDSRKFEESDKEIFDIGEDDGVEIKVV